MLLTSKDIEQAYREGFNGREESIKASKKEREIMSFRFNNTKRCGTGWKAKDFFWDGDFWYAANARIIERDGKTYWLNPFAEHDILILSEDEIKRSQAASALGSIRTPKKAKSSAENGKLGGRPKGIPAIQRKRGDEPWEYISSSYIFDNDETAKTELKRLRDEAKEEGWNVKYRIVRGSIVPV